MNWETVKGFARRHNQSFSERYRGVSKTEDTETEGKIAKVQQMAAVARNSADRMTAIAQHLDAVAELTSRIQVDFAALSASLEGQSDFAPELTLTAKKLELVAQDMRAKHATLNQKLNEVTAPMIRFCGEANQIHTLAEDRKLKMLEFDFFRNKVAGLRANPPGDTARIPRNEGRLQDWERQYQDSNQRLQKLCATLIDNGSRSVTGAGTIMTLEIGKYYDELGKGCRITCLSQGLGERAATAMAAVTSAAASNADSVVSPQAQAAAKDLATKAAAQTQQRFRPDSDDAFSPSNAQTTSSEGGPVRRRAKSNHEDDPFRV